MAITSFADLGYAGKSSGDFSHVSAGAFSDANVGNLWSQVQNNVVGAAPKFFSALEGSPSGVQEFNSAVGGGSSGPISSDPNTAALNLVDQRFEGLTNLNQSLVNTPTLPAGAQFQYTPQQLQQNELIQQQQLGDAPQAPTAIAGDAVQVAAPTTSGPANYDAFTNFAMAQMTPEQMATLSPEAIAEAAQGTVSPESTVQFQLAQLLDQFEDGEVPAWASGAIRNANSVMASRGLGASSLTGEAILNATMESALPIASADANVHHQLNMANLQNRQQAVMFNAQQAAQLDFTNMNNAQQAATVNMQARAQKLLSDQAATNAALQFNAQTEAQTEQFFAQLGTQVATQNAERIAAVQKANVDQINAQQRFNASIVDAREKFNLQARLEVDQANTNWRRMINTANNMGQNQTNMMNTQNLFNISQVAQANLWQQYRDEAHWAITASENTKNRQHNIAMVSMGQDFANSTMSASQKYETQSQLGALAANVVGAATTKWLNS